MQLKITILSLMYLLLFTACNQSSSSISIGGQPIDIKVDFAYQINQDKSVIFTPKDSRVFASGFNHKNGPVEITYIPE